MRRPTSARAAPRGAQRGPHGAQGGSSGALQDMFFFQAEDGIRDLVRSRGLGDVYKRQFYYYYHYYYYCYCYYYYYYYYLSLIHI